MAKQELKDFKQRVEEGEFAQSAEISASYLDEDILIIDNVKVLQNPDPVRLQMNMIASCLRGSLKVEYNGNILLVEKGDIFICPPNSTLDIVEVSGDFACTAMCVSNHGMLNILRSHISVWNRAMYVSKVSVLKMNEVDMVFYAKFTDLVRLCLDPSFCERTSWKPSSIECLPRELEKKTGRVRERSAYSVIRCGLIWKRDSRYSLPRSCI